MSQNHRKDHTMTTLAKFAALLFSGLPPAVAQYRTEHPKSRAVDHWTYYGSIGHTRRATCIYCRVSIATCSAAWPETKAFATAVAKHRCAERRDTEYRALANLSELSHGADAEARRMERDSL